MSPDVVQGKETADGKATARRDRLVRLLPEMYRAADAAQAPAGVSGPLSDFLRLICEQANLLEDDLWRWYDNWFIETCEDRIVPYLGDLVSDDRPRDFPTGWEERCARTNASVQIWSARADVANTLRLRRRKGTLAALEELAAHVAGWPAEIVEFRHQVAGTANLRGWPAFDRSRLFDARQAIASNEVGSPADHLPCSFDVRQIDSSRSAGRFNLSAIGVLVHRRLVDSATLVPAYRRAAGRFQVDVLGQDVALHVAPTSSADLHDEAVEGHRLPMPLTRRMLVLQGERGANPRYYGLGKSLAIFAQFADGWQLVPVDRIVAADLTRWKAPAHTNRRDWVAVDPELGRVLFSPHDSPRAVISTYHFGRTGLVGATESFRPLSNAHGAYTVGRGGDFQTIEHALDYWLRDNRRLTRGVIEITDNHRHECPELITVPADHTLEIRAAQACRPLLTAAAGDIFLCGEPGSGIALDGLQVGCESLRLQGEFVHGLLRHCSLPPRVVRLHVECADVDLTIDHCLLGAIAVPEPAADDLARDQANATCAASAKIAIVDSIVHAAPELADGTPQDDQRTGFAMGDCQTAAYAVLSAKRTTILGAARVRAIELVEDCILVDPLHVQNCQAGCVRYSYLPLYSRAPARFECHPRQDEPTIVPRFVSLTPEHPDYLRLRDDAPREILRGASDGGEMGVYHDEQFSRRADMLRHRLARAVPVDHEICILFHT